MAALTGQIAITGGAGGIGAACARAVRAAGGVPISLDLQANPDCDSHVVDVSDDSAMARALARIGPLSGLVCIAGTNARGRVEDLSWDAWRRVMAVNVRGTMLAMKHARLRDGGAMVLTASVSAHIGCDGYTAYHTSKGAVLGLMRATSGEFAPRGIRVNAVSPGWVDTAFTDRALAELPDGAAIRDSAGAAHILGRMARPAEIADAMVFLLSDRARFITGTELVVDGGFLRKR
ncbi:MAG: Dehydrogenase [Rhodobacteraceae bacterium HLUCCA08]|nr:MAG: Dehydrogenase [Rhodobacteraceae bacterium HLUCCA08]